MSAPATDEAVVDIRIEDHGSIILFRALTPEAREWINEHVQPEGWQWLGNGLSVEPRYVDDLRSGMIDDCLVVE